MNRFSLLKIAIAALLPISAACGDDDGGLSTATNFTATLTGANEVPPVTTPATGSATFTLVGSQLIYTITVSNLQNPILAHIHLAPAGQNGPVRLNLCGTGDPQPACTSGTSVLATGTNGTTVGDPPITFDDLLSAMRTGGAYVNVHTNLPGCTPGDPGCNPGGEIRGQVVAH
jgi:hypothetical protein